MKETRLSLERRYPTDMPEVVLNATPEWEHYIETEWRLRSDKTTPPRERVRQIVEASAAVQRLLAERREAARS